MPDAITPRPQDAGLPHAKTPRWRDAWLDLLAFALTLTFAYFLQWEVTDLVWSLWLASLVIGYTTIVRVIAGGMRQALSHAAAASGKLDPDDSNTRSAPAHAKHLPVAAIGGGVFMLVFFSFHFCGFHAGHASFLQTFFPLEGLKFQDFAKNFMWPPGLFLLAITHLVPSYGLFLLPALIAERRRWSGPGGGMRFGTSPTPDQESVAEDKTPTAKPTVGVLPGAVAQTIDNDAIGKAMISPYRNVVRMHLLIFFFAAVKVLELEHFIVFAVVYAVYFFPWHILRAKA